MTANHFPLARLRDALISDGIACVLLPEAQGRSARMFASVGYAQGCQAQCVHHTASSGDNPAGDIAYIVGGKGVGYVIANAYTARDGTVTLIASGPTYTEGSGGPLGFFAEDRANGGTFSNEIANPGDGSKPYPPAQQDAVVALSYHVGQIGADVWGWASPYIRERLFSHFEWAPGRKIDPLGPSRWATGAQMWDMALFRADVATHRQTTGDPTVFQFTNEQRLLDTRLLGSPAVDGQIIEIHVPVPGEGVMVTLAAIDTDQGGHLTAWDGIGEHPTTSKLNWSESGSVIANTTSVQLDAHNSFRILVRGSAHLTIDMVGVYVTPANEAA